MAAIVSSTYPNLANLAASLAPDGSLADITNLLSKKKILQDVPFIEGNLPTGHVISVQDNALPSASWRSLNRGVSATKVVPSQYTESAGILEDESRVDVALAKMSGNPAQYRQRQDSLKAEGISQQFETALFYESVTSNPERVHGLAPRYGATTGMTASSYTLNGTNAGTNCHSLWLIAWDPRKIYGFYPKHSQLGLQFKDKGEWRVLDSNSNPFWAFITNIVWNVGIAVEDYRYAVRFQWDPDDAAFADDDRGMYLALLQMLSTIYGTDAPMRFYMNRTSLAKLNAQLASNDARFLTYQAMHGAGGDPSMLEPHFNGVPVRITDQLVAETAIS